MVAVETRGRDYFAGLRVTKRNKATGLLILTLLQTPTLTITLILTLLPNPTPNLFLNQS
jgi:hypothetical protein